MLFLVYKFQSHQIFHVFVIAAAFVHYHGVVQLSTYRLSEGDCRPSDEILTKENFSIPSYILHVINNPWVKEGKSMSKLNKC